MKAECGVPGVHQSPDADAAFFFVDRWASLALMHATDVDSTDDGSDKGNIKYTETLHGNPNIPETPP